MKTRGYIIRQAMVLAGFGLAAAPAYAVDPWSITQFNQIQARTVGEGYAIGFARTIGTVNQTDIAVASSRWIRFGYSETNVFGSSEATGVAASVSGISSVNVISAQNISNLAGNVRVIVR